MFVLPVLSSSPQVTPQKPSIPPQQPDIPKECNNIKPTNCVTPRKPSADVTPRIASHEDTLTPTKWTPHEIPPTPPEPTSQLLRKTSGPTVAKKPGIPPPVSRKPPTEGRTKPLTQPDQLPEFPSPPRLPNERKEFPSPPRLPNERKEFPSPPGLPNQKQEFPSPPRLPNQKQEFPSPASVKSLGDDFPPPPPSVSYLLLGNTQEFTLSSRSRALIFSLTFTTICPRLH